MKKLLISSVIAALVSPGLAQSAETQADMADKYFSPDTVKLTAQEKKALDIGKQWQSGKATSSPSTGGDGAITFMYGAGQTQVVCAVLQVCDISLQPGEQFNTLNAGDPRYIVEPGISGSGADQTVHVILKPMDVGLDTALVVMTDRRVYHFRIRSTRNESMPFARFIYPEDTAAKWAAIRKAEAKDLHDNTLPQSREYLGNLDFNYTIDGKARWKPVRVYNDGTKTIIEMPDGMRQTESPTLVVVRREAGIFRDAETQMVNYRVQGNRYVVDTIFDKAVLIAGVGSSQDKITIERGGK
ncbi:P-type conjugative transfer protein TrbG [Pseudomonas syringae]|uniref:P-type conjugative transfer protein TrbG n=1 Tax=Pseudomonas syringae TaxID=317 RepID=UPI00200AD16E|nr:P-type conjugative transfer protein TrbG [Pseudomonas syringae]MCK9709895.1 P-type conjugative transfer protein TrbG [Pseudomonas syringae pv. syringae]